MTTDFTPAAMPDYREVLSQAARSYLSSGSFAAQSGRPQPERVVAALLEAERAAKQQRLQFSFADLAGQWRLCFTTGVKKTRAKKRSSEKRSSLAAPGKRGGGIRLKQGFYMPLWTPAQIGFSAAPEAERVGYGQGGITNQIQLAGVRLRFAGPAKYLGKKNLLAFDFTDLAIDCLGQTLLKTGFRGGQAKASQFEHMPIAKLPFFAFFSVTPDWIAARGRGGGLALWIREEAETHRT